MIVLRLALQSLRNRWLTATLTVFAIAVSIMLLLGVEKVRAGARQSFADTISGTDLIVGARSGSIQLLLYSVFRIGNATNNITWPSYQDIAARPEIAWVVPLSLGDSHRGFRVLGTTPDYFTHYKYRQTHGLAFASGAPFADLFDAVVGADVAAALGYKVGDRIIVSHGLGVVAFVEHDDKPFRVSGVLEKTGTPVDRTVHVSLEAIEAIHVDWQSGGRVPGQSVSADDVRRMDLKPKAITAALIGLKSRLATFRLQRSINEYRAEPLSAILPGAALQELWGLVGTAETALKAVSNTFLSSNYWVDIVFTTALNPTTLSVNATTPASGATSVNVSTTVTATLSNAIDGTTVNASTFQLKDAANVSVSASYSTSGTTASSWPVASNTVWSRVTAVDPTVRARSAGSAPTAP